MDLPVAYQNVIGNIDLGKIADKVADFSPAWDRETLSQIADGKVFVPDNVINDAIKKRIENDEDPPIKELVLKSHDNGMLDIDAMTRKNDKILLSGTIETFSQKDGKASFAYRVKKHKLPGHGLSSWIFSNVSLSMAQRLFGKVEFKNSAVPVDVRHNTVVLDLSDVLAASAFGSTEFMGNKLTNLLEIESAVPKEGGIEIDTKLNISPSMKDTLKRIIN